MAGDAGARDEAGAAGAARPDVALLLHSRPGFPGGVARVVFALAGQFAAEGLRAEVVFTGRATARPPELAAGAELVALGGTGLRDAFWPLVRYLRARRPRTVLSSMEHLNLMAVVARALAGVPARLVLATHSSIAQRVEVLWGPRDRLLLPWLIRRLFPRADAVVAVSDGVAGELRGMLGGAAGMVRRIYNPIHSPAIETAMAAPCQGDPFPGYAGPVILGAGRFSKEKDFPTLLAAFARARAQRDMRLVLLGDGEGRAGLEATARELGVAGDVGFPGMLANPFPHMRRAAVFALSSRWEGFGNVLVEAMACGTPVVATDCPFGPAEILQGGRLGRLVPVGDAAALATAILATLDAPPDPEALVARARDFSVEAAAAAYRDVLGL